MIEILHIYEQVALARNSRESGLPEVEHDFWFASGSLSLVHITIGRIFADFLENAPTIEVVK